MAAIKISSKVDQTVWEELKALAGESHQSISGLLTEAISEYLKRRRVRPDVLKHLDDSIADNEELGRLLASETVTHLTVDEVLVIHERLLVRFGGRPGVRDPGLLESALFRPRSGYYGDVAEMAAALFESLLLNHPFVDGNKRVAFFATDVFLRLNGWKLEVDAVAAHRFLIESLEAGCCDYQRLLPWLRGAMRRLL